MKWFYNLKIGTKLLAGFIFVALVAGVVGYVGIVNINEITARDTKLYEYETLPIAEIGRASAQFQRIRINLRDICIDKDMAVKTKYQNEILEQEKIVNEELAKFEQKVETDAGRQEFAKVKAAVDRFVAVRERIVQLAMAGQEEDAMAYLRGEVAVKAAGEVNDGILNLYRMKLDVAEKLAKENDATSAAAVNTMLVFAGVAVALAIGLGIFITRIITRPVRHLQVVMGQVEEGDLTVRGEVNTKDELGQLAASFNEMLDYLREFVQKVQEGSHAVASASEQISASTQQVAGGAQSQAQEAQTLSKMMDDMTGAAAQVAGSAQKAALSSEQTTAATDDGGQIIARTVEGMDEIANNVMTLGQSSEKIGEIVEMIDDIAAQTNLLALNAAIEAARAGEAGKGFAVVADEVRKLAERSGVATKDIAVLIKNIQAVTTQAVAATENGRDLTHKAGAAFETIKDQVKQTAAEVAEIAAAAEEQAATVEQASQAVQNVAAISEESSAGAEETAGATQSMTHLAAELQAAAARYKV